jgi:hypothetical protein
MLKLLDEFRKILDDMMLEAMHRRVVLYGYGYTGRFLKWYAKYYHSIDVDYIITLDISFSRPYDQELFQTSLFNFNYKDVSNAVVWLAEPYNDEIGEILKENGYVKNITYFDFYEAVYGKDINWGDKIEDPFIRRKSGKRDIQFLEWLEWKYGCNFVEIIDKRNFEVVDEHGAGYKTSSPKELFPILDKCHCIPNANDAIFDYGCGKGGAMVSFMDYGFCHVGGVEFEPKIYDILVNNIKKLNLQNEGKTVECIKGNAADINEQLDRYNWFNFYAPFDGTILSKCINAINKSLERKQRKIHIIVITPKDYRCVENVKRFRLVNQFTIETRQRVVDIYENIY